MALEISTDAVITLTCGHAINKEILSRRAETHVAAAFKLPLSCDICDTPVAGYLLQQVMTFETFLKYKTKQEEAQAKYVYCPNCNAAYLPNAEMLKLATQVGCQYCGLQFCSRCQRQWDGTHDMKVCMFEDRQRQIEELKRGRFYMGDMIAQCPTCKVPYRGTFKTETISCTTFGCRKKWCFQCCALINPIKMYGNHFHRPDCRLWTPANPTWEHVQTPPQLKVPQRFDFDEY